MVLVAVATTLVNFEIIDPELAVRTAVDTLVEIAAWARLTCRAMRCRVNAEEHAVLVQPIRNGLQPRRKPRRVRNNDSSDRLSGDLPAVINVYVPAKRRRLLAGRPYILRIMWSYL